MDAASVRDWSEEDSCDFSASKRDVFRLQEPFSVSMKKVVCSRLNTDAQQFNKKFQAIYTLLQKQNGENWLNQL